MTGYGLAKFEIESKIIQVEIRSLNSKFLDLNFRTMTLTPIQDLWIRSECNHQIQRGKVSINLIIEESHSLSEKEPNCLDYKLLNSYLKSLSTLALEYQTTKESLFLACLNFPGIIKNTEEAPNEKIWSAIQPVFLACIQSFNEFRDREGKAIDLEMKMRLNLILALLNEIEVLAPARIDKVKTRLLAEFQEWGSNLSLDQNKFEQELIYYIDKIDISEEISRLKTHGKYFFESLIDPAFNGKKLGFILQEIGREINTIGSKANDALIQQKVVQMKDELEKMKEQVANIL